MSGAPANRVEAAGEAPARRWSFGPAVLDERTLELTVNGEVVTVERKPLEVLLFLLHHAGEVATKDEILEAVWPGRILTETVLTKAIGRIREALGDESQTLIKTQHGYGYRLIAPVKVEASTAPSLPRFDFKPGDSPPLRPRWKLEECLGTGGHGEAWRARHEKTREVRVYKFALDSTALGSLKREITIYRLLHDALPERTDFVSILDWNLEEPPYFLEIEHAGLNLVQWAESQGGLPRVPLETRLEIAARIAEALAAAHSVGVLHKDLKPSNVLVADAVGRHSHAAESAEVGKGLPTYEATTPQTDAGKGGEGPHPDPLPKGEGIRIKLSDFGSGGVLDPGRLEALGITRLGFTKTVKTEPTTSGTPIYFAPEVTAGQPFTVQSDIYALGVMLYQLIVADLKKALATGWEREVDDELLREDVTVSTEGSPAVRLTDAGELAKRLRSAEERRARRRAEQLGLERVKRAHEEAERSRQLVERLRTRRKWLIAVSASLGLGVLVSTCLAAYAFYVKDRAIQYAMASQAVSNFMNEELLGGIRWTDQSTVGAYRYLLEQASSKIGTRFAGQPDIATQVHTVFAMRYLDGGQMDLALEHAERARELAEQTFGASHEQTMFLRGFIGYMHERLGNFGIALPLYREVLRDFKERYGPDHLFTLTMRWHMGSCDLARGDNSAALIEFRDLLEAAQRAGPLGPIDSMRFKVYWALDSTLDISLKDFFIAQTEDVLANALAFAGELAEAETRMRHVVEQMTVQLGEDHFLAEGARFRLARVLLLDGRVRDAEAVLLQKVDPATGWPALHHAQRAQPPWFLGQLRLEQGRFGEAMRLLERAMALCSSDQGCGTHRRIEIAELLAQAYRRNSRAPEAVTLYRTILEYRTATLGVAHPWTLPAVVALAETLVELGKNAEAAELLAKITPTMLSALPKRTPALSRYRDLEAARSGEAVGQRSGSVLHHLVRHRRIDRIRRHRREHRRQPVQDPWHDAVAPLQHGTDADRGDLRGVPDRHPVLANLRRVQGLLWHAEGKTALAKQALQEARQIYELRHGPQNWRTRRAREELARVSPASKAGGNP